MKTIACSVLALATIFTSSAAQTDNSILTLSGHTGWVLSVVFSPDGSKVLTSSYDHTARVWNATTGNVEFVLSGHTNLLSNAVYNPDGSRIATCSWDSTAKIWDTENGELIYTLTGHTGIVRDVAFSPDGIRVATVSFDSTLRIWDVSTGQQILKITGHRTKLQSVAFSPDGTQVVSGGSDGFTHIWSVTTGQEMLSLAKQNNYVTRLCYSPDGSLLATITYDTVRLWDTESGECLDTIPGEASFLIFSHDGQRLLMAGGGFNAGRGHNAILRDRSTGIEMARFEGHADYVYSADFNPDESLVATSSRDLTVKIFRNSVKSGIDESPVDRHISLLCHPSPASGILHIDYSLELNAQTTIFLSNDVGQTVSILMESETGLGPHTVDFNISTLPAGIYHCTLRTQYNAVDRTIIVVR